MSAVGSGVSTKSSGESPALPRKRARLAAFSEDDDDEDEWLDIPLDQRPAPQQQPLQQIQGLEDEEGEDDEWDDVQEVAAPAEPAMRRRIEKDQSCKPSV